MLPRPLHIVLAALLGTVAGTACAQPAPGGLSQEQEPATPPELAPTPEGTPAAAPPELDIEPLEDPALPRIERALSDAAAGRMHAVPGDLASHPLYPWVEHAALVRDMTPADESRVLAFLQQYRGEAVAAETRRLWLAAMARHRAPASFLRAWDDTVTDTALRCAWLDARAQQGQLGKDWTREAQSIWTSSGRSLPDACDPVFDSLAAQGGLPDALRWQRLEMAAEKWEPGVMRSIARGFAGADRELGEDYAAFIAAPHARALQWPRTDRSRLIASHGLARLGKEDPDRAESMLPQYAQALGFTEDDRGRVLFQVALWTVASYLPGGAERLARVPASSYDDQLHEWRVREALSRSDWPAALAAIRLMGPEQRNDSRYQYFEARLAELTGDPATAQEKYRAAARKPEFHGFLAADRLDLPYALCPRGVEADEATRRAVEADPALQRALRLHRIGRHRWAVLEWSRAVEGFSDTGRHYAVAMAQANGWFDRAVFALRGEGENRLYGLRFPLHHDEVIRREAARNDIDPAWAAAEIRAESIFNPDARSPADARGLMQVLPSTGAAVARRIGYGWEGGQSLYDPETSIVLGTAYLRQMLDETGGKPYFAIAGYNAGPAPLARWRSQRPGMDADFWIETISYKETREYVARVLAFSVIYDWRLDGDALRLTDRMEGRTDGPRKEFRCPAGS
ncbi:lytic transglycosylase domain-containing protein [Novilysobacter defluvii]|uniref:lytic transglycosylase domain-containing protein n=1 Tax=Novilysobacter defluvii TaxID=391738 RepID=UPI000691C03D|nr:lytic transglycosylase domain-containing protein [Lysobacter defluvii]